MPKIVDHDARRSDIASAVHRVVARDGVRGANIRSVADEAGWSTGVIAHYFGDKQALLTAALHEAAQRVRSEMTIIHQRKHGNDRIQALLEAGMPLDAERASTCRIFFHFSSEGFNDPEFRSELAGYYAWWRAQVQDAIEQSQSEGTFSRSQNAAQLSETFVALAEGLGIQGMFDPRAMSRTRLRARVKDLVHRLGQIE